MDEAPLTLAVDLGGTRMRAALVTGDGELIDRHAEPTPRDATCPDALMALVESLAAAWRAALEADGPTALMLSRQALPSLPPHPVDVSGAIIAEGAQATILATGSEVHGALAGRDLLSAHGVAARVVSLPSWERFRARPTAAHSRDPGWDAPGRC
jgi:hypothetical protein